MGGDRLPSLSGRLITRLSLAIGLVSLGVCLLYVLIAARTAGIRLDEEADQLSANLAATLEKPLWDYDAKYVEFIGRTFAKNSLIAQLIIRDSDGVVCFSFTSPGERGGIVRQARVSHGQADIGTVDLVFTRRFYREGLLNVIVVTAITALIIIAMIFLVTGHLVRRLLKAPLEHFSRVVDAYGNDATHAVDATSNVAEFQQFSHTLSAMGSKIRQQLIDLRNLNASLQAKNVALVAMEAELRDREQRLRSLSDGLTEGLIYQLVMGPDGSRRFTYLSDAVRRLYGITPEEGLRDATLIYDRVHDDDRPALLAAEDEAQRTCSVFRKEVRIRDPSGTYRWSSLVSTPLAMPDGSVRWDGLEFIITARMQAEEELRQHRERLEELVAVRTRDLAQASVAAESANRAKSDFLSSMSHEIRTPLNAVLGYAQLLARDPTLAANHRRAVEVLNRSGEHLLSLISDILEMSRIEAGRTSVDLEDFDLHDLLDNLKSLFLLRARDKGLELGLELAAGLPRCIRCDQRKLRQILVNLLSNAVKFTSAGRVDIRASFAADRLHLEVRDSGPGITQADQERLFEPFVQGSTRRGRSEGSGLGLALSRGFARLIGGNLGMSSRIGHGSCFTVEVPVKIVDQADRAPLSRREVVGLAPDVRSPRILIAEDHHDSRHMLYDVLVQAGLEVRAVGDGAAAVEVCRQWRPALVWMDIDMPVMDGLAATRAMRALPGDRPVIIALTAAAFSEDRARILAGGCDEVMRKPFRADELFALIERHLGIGFIWRDTSPATETVPVIDDAGIRQGLQLVAPAALERLRLAMVTGDLEAIRAFASTLTEGAARQGLLALVESFDVARLQALMDSLRSSPDGGG